MAKKPSPRKNLRPGGLQDTPAFYKSMGNAATVNRLKGVDVRLRVPVIDLFLRGRCQATSNTIFFNKSFKKIPLVTGLLREPDGTVKRIYPDNQFLAVRRSSVILGSGSFPVEVNSVYHLKVYNLDLEGAVSRTTT